MRRKSRTGSGAPLANSSPAREASLVSRPWRWSSFCLSLCRTLNHGGTDGSCLCRDSFYKLFKARVGGRNTERKIPFEFPLLSESAIYESCVLNPCFVYTFSFQNTKNTLFGTWAIFSSYIKSAHPFLPILEKPPSDWVGAAPRW